MRPPLPVDPRYPTVVWAVLLILSFPAASPARIIGDVVSAGLNARGTGFGGRRVVRIGAWTPIVVQLTLEGQTQFNGTLRVAQRDRDGDVCYDYHDVLLNVDSRATRTYTLYTLPTVGPDGGVKIDVELLNEEGEVAEMVSSGRLVRSLHPADAPVVLSDDEYLILEVSEGQMGTIARLADPQQNVRPLRSINVAHIAPGDVPDRWQGLEAVDCVIWDQADPDAINTAQRRALAEWTRQGGLLVPATARYAPALQKSDVFGPMLPVHVGSLTTLTEARRFRIRWLGLPEEEPAYTEPVPLARCSLRQGCGARKVFPVPGTEAESPGLDTLIARRRVGRGSLVFVAAALSDLIEGDCDPSTLFRRVLEIRTTSQELLPDESLYTHLEGKVGFGGIGSIYLVFAMLFALAYVGLATFGSWGFLKSRGWDRHNWTVFAIVAAAASVVSVTAAQTVRGVGQKLHQLTIVDAAAGSPEASAVAYFGIKTGTHSVLDVWLPEDYAQRPEPHPTGCFLRPLPVGQTSGASGGAFADPGSYDLRPATAELLRVPVRATLKQFEGRWHGGLRGGIDASVRIIRRSFEKSETDSDTIDELCFDGSSRITNRLGVDLDDCYIFQPTENTYVRGTVNFRRAKGKYEIMVHQLGPIADGATFDLASLYYDRDGNRLTWEQWHHSLAEWQNHWGKNFAGSLGPRGRDRKMRTAAREPYQEALLLLTALSEYDEDNPISRHYASMPVMFSRERCRPLDLSDILTKDMVLLVGFAKGPGPADLCTRSNPKRAYKRVHPDEAWTVYRIVIPVRGR